MVEIRKGTSSDAEQIVRVIKGKKSKPSLTCSICCEWENSFVPRKRD